jgi:hypothetical protein
MITIIEITPNNVLELNIESFFILISYKTFVFRLKMDIIKIIVLKKMIL